MKRKVIFTEDFAIVKKGDSHEFEGPLASHLVRIDKVAKFADAPTEKKVGNKIGKKK